MSLERGWGGSAQEDFALKIERQNAEIFHREEWEALIKQLDKFEDFQPDQAAKFKQVFEGLHADQRKFGAISQALGEGQFRYAFSTMSDFRQDSSDRLLAAMKRLEQTEYAQTEKGKPLKHQNSDFAHALADVIEAFNER